MREERSSVEFTGDSFAAAQERYARDEARSRQSLPGALVAGALAAAVGASLWAFATVTTGFQSGWMAVGVGFLVGWAVRLGGKSSEPVFGVLGALLSLLGCLGGQVLSIYGMVARETHEPFFELLAGLEWGLTWELMVSFFSPVDLLFYGIAIYEGYRFSLLASE